MTDNFQRLNELLIIPEGNTLQAASSVWKKKSRKINSNCHEKVCKALQIGLEPAASPRRKGKVQFFFFFFLQEYFTNLLNISGEKVQESRS
jgi:hypothetical protein